MGGGGGGGGGVWMNLLKKFFQVERSSKKLYKLINWFHFLIREGGLPIILIDCMIFLSPFLDATTKMSMSKVSFLEQLASAILCL